MSIILSTLMHFLLLPEGVVAAPRPVAARLICVVTDNGRPSEGIVRVLKRKAVVARGSCTAPLSVPAGDYRVEVEYPGALDKPRRTLSWKAAPGSTGRLEAEFETGLLHVMPLRQGGAGPINFHIQHEGRALASLPAGPAVRLSAGTYTVSVDGPKGQPVVFRGVHVAPAARRTLVVGP